MTLIGKELGGCRLDRLIGQGGMGEVYLATQLSLEREVAVKVLNQNLASNEEFRERFKREARSIAKVNHPNILQIFEVGQQDNIHFMIMEFIDGENISARLERDGFIPWHDAAELVIQAAEGLENAANVGIMHRDIKPDNLMLTRTGQVKVSDFGLAKQARVDLTQTNTVMGTPAYMSPEQCDGENLDTRTDIYSLGATLYRMVTGVLPFNAPSPMAIMYKHKHEEPTPPQRYVPNIPEDLSYIIFRMMEKNPDRRYQTMHDVVAALERCVQTHPAPGASSSAEMTMKLDGSSFDFEDPKPTSARVSPKRRSTAFMEAIARRDTDTEQKSVDEYIREGDELMAAGHPSAAMETWRQALALDPNNPDLKTRIEHSTSESVRYNRQLGESLLQQGNIADLRRALFERLSQNGEDVDAREQLQALDEMDRHKRDVVGKIRSLLGANEYQQALDLWDELHPELREQAMEKTIQHVRTVVLPLLRLVTEAKVLADSGNYESAAALYERAAELDANHELVRSGIRETRHILDRIEQYLRDGYEASIDGRHEEAVSHYRRVLDLSPGHTKARQFAIENQMAIAEVAERKSDVATAHAAWAEVLTFDRTHLQATEKTESLYQKLVSINDRLALAQKICRQHSYGSAVSLYQQVLRDDPENRRALYGYQDARRGRFYRRRLPILLALLFGLLGMVGYWWNAYEGHQFAAEQNFAQGNYQQAVDAWKAASETPLWGKMTAKENQDSIQQAQYLIRGAAIQAIPVYSDFMKEATPFRKELQTASFAKRDTMMLDLILAEAALLYKTGDMEATYQIYETAGVFAKEKKLVIPREHTPHIDGLQAYWTGRAAEEAKNIHSAISYYDTAERLLPDLSDAVRRRTHLTKTVAGITNASRRAQDLITKAQKSLIWNEQFPLLQEAQTLLRTARAADPSNQDTHAMLLDIQWRLDAGADMVFFRLDENTAFAIDRYEYPNQVGIVPERVSFLDARQKAANLNKALPTRIEWEYAARSGTDTRRKFPYGNSFDPAASCNSISGIERLAPEPAGSFPRGNTPEGIADMTGNVAEWIDDKQSATERYANAMGGHFGSRTEYDLSCDTQKQYRMDIVDAHVGFRCVRRYSTRTTPLREENE